MLAEQEQNKPNVEVTELANVVFGMQGVQSGFTERLNSNTRVDSDLLKKTNKTSKQKSRNSQLWQQLYPPHRYLNTQTI